MRVLLVSHEFSASGASHLLFGLALHLKAAGHRLTVAALNPAPGRLHDAYAAAGVTLANNVRPEDFDVCLANTFAAAPLVISLSPRVPILWWLHEAEVGLALLLQNPGWVGAFARARVVVFQTAFQRDDVYRSFVYGLDPGRLHVVANAVAVDRSTLPPVAPRQGTFRIVSVGTVYPRKRHGDMVAAAAALQGRLDAEVVICGAVQDGLDEPARRVIAARPDRFRLTGEVDRAEALAWMASADVFCLASDSESEPLTALEAGLLGRPLVLSDLPSYRSTYRHDENCLTFPVGDIGRLAEALGFLAEHPERRLQLGQAALEVAQARGEAAFHARMTTLLESASRSVK